MGFTPSGSSLVQSVISTLTSAQILSLNTSPVNIAPALGAGLAYMPMFATFNYRAGGVAYVPSGGTLSVGPLPIGVIQLPGAGFLDQAGSQAAMVRNGTTTVFPLASWSNQPLTVGYSVANPTTGNGTLVVEVLYYVMAVA